VFKLSALLAVISVGLTVWCLVEAVSADESRVRRLPKALWILLILLVPFVAPLAWLLGGRPSVAAERAAAAAAFAEFERPGRLDPIGTSDPSEPAKDAAYRELLRRRAEEQRLRYEQQKKKTHEPEAE